MFDKWRKAFEKRGEPIPGARVRGHGITYITEDDANAMVFRMKAITAGEYKLEHCETCKGWHIERI